MTLHIAFDYGGRAEILEAVCRIVKEKVAPEDINEDLFNRYLYTAGVPDPDCPGTGRYEFLCDGAGYEQGYVGHLL